MKHDIIETTDLTHCHALRRTVFIEEQHVSEAEEMDGLDHEAIHLLATCDGTPVGTSPLRPVLCHHRQNWNAGRIDVWSHKPFIG